MRKRVFTNPVIGDKVTLIKTSEETNGEYTLFEIEVIPGGGNSLHIHESFSEKFEVLDGELTLRQGKGHHVLKKGESAIVPQKAPHCFANKSDKTVKFNVEFRPAQPGFEKGIASNNFKFRISNFRFVTVILKQRGSACAVKSKSEIITDRDKRITRGCLGSYEKKHKSEI
jgi:quercetin dioxygenase-like cupin family protein